MRLGKRNDEAFGGSAALELDLQCLPGTAEGRGGGDFGREKAEGRFSGLQLPSICLGGESEFCRGELGARPSRERSLQSRRKGANAEG